MRVLTTLTVFGLLQNFVLSSHISLFSPLKLDLSSETSLKTPAALVEKIKPAFDCKSKLYLILYSHEKETTSDLSELQNLETHRYFDVEYDERVVREKVDEAISSFATTCNSDFKLSDEDTLNSELKSSDDQSSTFIKVHLTEGNQNIKKHLSLIKSLYGNSYVVLMIPSSGDTTGEEVSQKTTTKEEVKKLSHGTFEKEKSPNNIKKPTKPTKPIYDPLFGWLSNGLIVALLISFVLVSILVVAVSALASIEGPTRFDNSQSKKNN